MKLVTTKFKLGGLHEKNVVETWNVGNRLSICFYAQRNQEKPVSSWPVVGTYEKLTFSQQSGIYCKTTAMHTQYNKYT